MSSRNFRKMVGGSLPDNESDSDGVFDPLGNRPSKKTTYEGLQISTDSEAEKEYASDEAAQAAISIAHGGARKKKTQKKNGKKAKKSKRPGGTGDPGPSTSDGTNENGQGQGPISAASQLEAGLRQGARRRNSRYEELDEIDRSIMEINELLGPPSPTTIEQTCVKEHSVLDVQAKHLNVAYEIRRMFGPDEPDEIRDRLKTQPHRARLLRRVLVQPASDTTVYDFRKTGLTMSIYGRDKDITYFVYDHDEYHRRMHNAFLHRYAIHLMNQDVLPVNLDDSKKFMHVEPLLEITDSLFRMEEYTIAVELVENMVAYLQYVAHPSFNLASTNVRLLYTYIENRPFHVVMLKYAYLLSNRACHRTALEIAKMLINIDPADPLAVVFIIDTLALRAREHKWLIEAIEYFNENRETGLLFNMQYSYALAHYHVAMKTKTDVAVADNHLQKAILSYPQVTVKILEFGHMSEPKIQGHRLFASEPVSRATEGLNELIMIYARLIWPKWREPEVKEWFFKNIVAVADSYDSREDVQQHARQLMVLRHNIFQAWPPEILRHISVIRSMSTLLIETTLPPITGITSSWDPLFERGINRYGYKTPADPPNNPATRGPALLYRFFTSIIPNTGLDPPVND